MRKKAVITLSGIALAAMIITGGTGLGWPEGWRLPFASVKDSNGGNNRTADASPIGPSRSAITALGRIEPASEIVDVGVSGRDRLERLVVAEGDGVRAGQVLGFLESYYERVAEREEIAAKLREAKQLLAAEDAFYTAQIHEEELRIEQIRESGPLRISVQKAKIRSLEAELANNIDIFKSRRKLLATQVQSRRTVDDQGTLVKQNEEDLAGARALLAQLKSEMRLDLLLAETAVRRATAARTRARASVALESLRKQYALAEKRAWRATVRAPIDGEILKVLIWPGEQTGDQPILKMGDTSTMYAVAEVYETDIGSVRIGQRARVSSPVLHQPLDGVVEKIGNLIFKNDILNVDPAADADARIVEVRVRLETSAAVKKLSNLTVDVRIEPDAPETARP